VERGLAAAGLVVAPSRWMLDELHQHYRFATPSRAIHNARTPNPYPPSSNPQIFSAGRLWDEGKNLGAVLAAAPHIHWPIKIAGDGGAPAANVQHLGWLGAEEIARVYAESAIYLFPALYEPFGLSVLEAALSGCALILGDIPSLREIWGDAALYVPARDAGAIARVTNEVIANDALRGDLARRAQQRAARYTPRAMADGYAAVYRELTARMRRGAA